MSQSLDMKEEIISEFIKTVSKVEYKNCDEIENDLQKIVYMTRGLIHNNPDRPRALNYR
jgi:hypothetical protein